MSFVEEQSTKKVNISNKEEIVKDNSSDEGMVEASNEISVENNASNDITETEDANDIFNSIM